jgi:tRNA A-37 threonylcarbamoyl transferase component Bud32/tetratricopeptide (TPR) repeat protein
VSDSSFSRAKEIFLAAVELDPDEQMAFVEEECRGDAELRAEVVSLLGFSEARDPATEGDILAAAESPGSDGWPGLRPDPAAFDRFRDLLADRYRMEGEIGRGGMATVYRAHDLRHDRRVALKVLSPEVTALLGPDRFLREIRIVAQIQHPHVLPLYDSGEAGGFLFYVMPLVEGGTARTRLREGGGLEMEEAVRILRDVAEALAEAHIRGIVHRDIKPDNVLISGRNAMVADFGLAKAVSAARGDPGLTGTGLPLGTPAYMSPEQVAGDPDIDFRADIYAFGVLAFELLAGRTPFTAPTPREMLSAHLNVPPPDLSELRRDLPEPLVELVRRCLAKGREDRWPSADAMLAVLDRVAQPSADSGVAVPDRAAPPTPPPPGGLGRWIRGGLIGLPVVGFLILALTLGRREPPPPLDPNRVFLAGFVNETGDTALDHLGGIASDWVSRGLQEAGAVVVLGSGFLAPDPAQADADGRTGVGRFVAAAEATGAGTVLTGAVYRLGDSVRFQAQFIDTRSAELRVSMDPVTGPLSAPLGAVDLLRRRLMSAATFLASPSQQAMPIRPPVYEAYREWVSALRLTAEQDLAGAAQGFQRATALDSTFFVAHLMTSGMLIGLRRLSDADSILDWMETKLESLTPLERTAWEGQRARLRGDIEGWLEASRRAGEIMPYSPATRDLGEGPIFLNRPREAIAFLDQLDFSQEFVDGWTQFWEFYHDAHHLLGQYDEALEVAERGRARYPNSTLVSLIDVPTLAALGRIEAVNHRLDAALSRPSQPGLDLGEAMLDAAAELRVHGHPEESREMLQRFHTWLNSLSAEEASTQGRRRQLVDALNLEDRHTEALDVARGLARDFPEAVNLQGRMGRTAAAAGDTETAWQVFRWLGDQDAPYTFGEEAVWRARIAAILGDREQAVSLLREALARGLHHGMWFHRDNSLESLRGYPPFDEIALPQ